MDKLQLTSENLSPFKDVKSALDDLGSEAHSTAKAVYDFTNAYQYHSRQNPKTFTLRNGQRYPAARLIWDSINGPYRNPSRLKGRRIKPAKS